MQLKSWDGLVDWLVRLCFLKLQTHHEVLGFDLLIRRNRFTDSKSQASWGCRSTNCNLWWWQSRRQIDRIKLNKQQTFHHIKLRPVISIPSKYNYYNYWVPLLCLHRNPLSCFFRSEISHLTVGPCRCLRGRRALEQLSIGRLRRLPKARERERREINDVIFNALLKMVEMVELALRTQKIAFACLHMSEIIDVISVLFAFHALISMFQGMQPWTTQFSWWVMATIHQPLRCNQLNQLMTLSSHFLIWPLQGGKGLLVSSQLLGWASCPNI